MAESVKYEDIVKILFGPEPEKNIRDFFSRIKATIINDIKDVQAQLLKSSNDISAKNIKEQQQIASKLGTVKRYRDQLNVSEEQSIRLARQLSAAEAKMTPENIKLAAAIRERRAETNRLIAEQQKLNGSYKPGVISGFINQIKGLAAAYLSLQAAFAAVKGVFTVTKDLNVLSQSYKYLITDSEELAVTQAYLKNITKAYGLELISTSNSYLKFRASIQGANFDLNDAQKIFTAVSKAGSVLGLNAQRMELVFLALEQMISKGTVSTEELRRQLGDNIPGAMRIMADALGVTIPKLLDMVKANEVLSADALPKFAAQLEKAYGIENVTKIDNMQASVNRLRNTWVNAVEEMKASGGFTWIIEQLTKLLTTDKMQQSEETTAIISKNLSSINFELDKIREKGDSKAYQDAVVGQWNKAMVEMSRYKAQLASIEQQIASSQAGYVNQALIKDAEEAQVKYNAWLQIVKELDKYMTEGLKKAGDEKLAPVTDETLDKLRKEVALASGVIAKLQAKINLNEYLIKQSKDMSGTEQRRLILENDQYEKQIGYLKDVTNYRDIIRRDTEKMSKTVGSETTETEDKITSTLEKQFEQEVESYEEYEAEILEMKNRFGEQIGLADKIRYDEEVDMLKEFHEKNRLTDQQYLSKRLQLWMQQNGQFIDSADQFVNSFTSMLSELNRANIESAEEDVKTYETKLDELRGQLEEEQRLKDAGKANDYDRTVTQIAETQRLRDEANKKLAVSQKREAQIQLAAQASDIVTATANIIEGWTSINPVAGVIMGLAQVAAMITAFAAYKNQINSMSKYAEGTEYLERGNRPKGKDTIPIWANEGERIVPDSINAKLDGIDNEKLPEIYRFYKQYHMRGTGAMVLSNSDVVRELKRGRQVSEKMYNHMKTEAQFFQLRDGRILKVNGPHNTEVINLG